METKDIHLFANGNDPFILPIGEYVFHIHAGAPPHIPSTESGPVAEAVGAPVTPIMSAYPHKTPIGTPMALTPIHGTDEMRNWLNQVELELGDQPLHLRLDTVSGRSRPEVPALLESLQSFSGHDVNVEIVCWSEPGNG